MFWSVEILSRIQFAFTLSFHYIYPPMSIGLGLALIFMEGMYLKTGSKQWESITRFWVRVFALTFALGVATGIPLQFSLGTNWARYSRFVGDVFGSALAAEGFFAFLVEAGFLGILIFGWDRVSKTVHFTATLLVALGAHFSALWIVIANSWMHTPAGYELVTAPDGVVEAHVTSWFAMILNPSSLRHVSHVLTACWMAGGLLILSIASYYLIKGKHRDFAIPCFKIGTAITLVAAVLQLFTAHALAGTIAKYNPEKMAAFEGVFKTEDATPMYLFGWADEKTKTVSGVSLPGLLSFLVYGNFHTPVPGLDQFKRDQWPLVNPVFQAYHLMVGCWFLIFSASLIGAYVWVRGQWHTHRWMLRYLVVAVVLPHFAGIAGWFAACMGRQPWVVYKVLKTKEAFSQTITASQNFATLCMFVFAYLMFFVLFLWLLDRKIKHGPDLAEEHLTYRNPFHEDQDV